MRRNKAERSTNKTSLFIAVSKVLGYSKTLIKTDFNIAESKDGKKPHWEAASRGHLDILRNFYCTVLNTQRKSNGSTATRATTFRTMTPLNKKNLEIGCRYQ